MFNTRLVQQAIDQACFFLDYVDRFPFISSTDAVSILAFSRTSLKPSRIFAESSWSLIISSLFSALDESCPIDALERFANIIKCTIWLLEFYFVNASLTARISPWAYSYVDADSKSSQSLASGWFFAIISKKTQWEIIGISNQSFLFTEYCNVRITRFLQVSTSYIEHKFSN